MTATDSTAGGGVVTIGETMALLSAPSYGPLQHVRNLTLGIGGSESNVAIALRRLGVDSTWIGKVGADSLGDLILREIGAEAVHVVAFRDADAPTSLMIKERRTGSDTQIWYYRRGNAGSRLRAEELASEPAVTAIRDAAVLHVTGISPALSAEMGESILHAIRLAKEAGRRVSFDLNYRSKLWSREEAKLSYLRVIPLADIVFAGHDEAEIALGQTESSRELAHRLADAGAGHAIIKLGERGAVAVVDGREYEQPAIEIDPVDTVGAGDAFVAGYLAEMLDGADVETRLKTAVTVGAYVCLSEGDWEGAPRRHELEHLKGTEPVRR